MPYERLDVYQKSALEIHRLTLGFPRIEQHELASQLRRSSKSIPGNIAEGMGKQDTPADVRRFIKIALGSCDEARVWLRFCKDLGYLGDTQHQQLEVRYQEIGRMLQGLIKRYSDVPAKSARSR
jgi:four helix bundle protein